MTPLPFALGGPLLIWRLDLAEHAQSWDSGEGAYRVGGRWNSKGRRAVYTAFDPATAILEVAVHKGFRALDAVPHTLTAAEILNAANIHVVTPEAVPERSWLEPGIPSTGQQAFGDALLAQYDFVAFPSVPSRFSWNLVFDPVRAATGYREERQVPFVLDPRLHNPKQ
ncbi:hypothetical protein CHU93_00960 [Sandarakinorhabdus cyanobacteriorum]|uniref:RES domain-containing protein n=1 Tax=Sandarakinorhabdus cyanobacteriorum TaxID=1981098 RepID=A0A255Z522_9SPHN|nr:RES domain-containing protein [Sandarakinorhabdus cyanobacteriorum]OYQ36588.1 hypothetical protein CHU93_00960 [Sandarakinorhabdus cyanobacteriorum]